MTQQAPFSNLLSVPVAAILGAVSAKADSEEESSVALGPGKYTIARGVGIGIAGASGVHITGRTFEGTSSGGRSAARHVLETDRQDAGSGGSTAAEPRDNLAIADAGFIG